MSLLHDCTLFAASGIVLHATSNMHDKRERNTSMPFGMDERKALEWDTLSSPGTVHSRQQKIIDAFWFWWKEDLKMRYIGLPCDRAYTNTSKRCCYKPSWSYPNEWLNQDPDFAWWYNCRQAWQTGTLWITMMGLCLSNHLHVPCEKASWGSSPEHKCTRETDKEKDYAAYTVALYMGEQVCETLPTRALRAQNSSALYRPCLVASSICTCTKSSVWSPICIQHSKTLQLKCTAAVRLGRVSQCQLSDGKVLPMCMKKDALIFFW